MHAIRALVVSLLFAALVPACAIETHPTVGVRANREGEAVILAPRCSDERIEAVQVADLDGPVRWRIEGDGSDVVPVFVVGAVPPSMRERDPLEGVLDPDDAYVATVEYAGSLPDTEVEFRTSSLSPDRVIDDEGVYRTRQEFIEEADLDCAGGWLWVAAAIGIAVLLVLLAAAAGSVWVIVRTLRKAKRMREAEVTPDRPDLSGR